MSLLFNINTAELIETGMADEVEMKPIALQRFLISYLDLDEQRRIRRTINGFHLSNVSLSRTTTRTNSFKALSGKVRTELYKNERGDKLMVIREM